jgi:hypothetical protein
MVAMKEAIEKIKNKNKTKSLLSAGTPIRMLGQYIANKQIRKKRKEEINKLIMQVDDMKLDGETRERKRYIKNLIARAKLENTYKKLDEAKAKKK